MYPANVFRIFIASPSDVTEERDIADEVIRDWNNANSAADGIVILPVRWETHSSPEYGPRPQAVINRQLLDHCDLLVGIFWTRIGSPTGEAESGTLEEIEEAAKAGKRVMLYFSRVRQNPEKIDPDQLKKVRDFKQKTFPKALFETYRTANEFRRKFNRQLAQAIKELIASANAANDVSPVPPPITDIRLHFADLDTGEDRGTSLSLKTRLISVPDFENIPDNEEPIAGAAYPTFTYGGYGVSTTTPLQTALLPSPDKDYFRKYATYLIHRNLLVPIRFWFKNLGGIGARDVYVDISIVAEKPILIVWDAGRLPSTPPKPQTFFDYGAGNYLSAPTEITRRMAESFRGELEVNALQPQREVSPAVPYLIGTLSNAKVIIAAKIYADTLPRPTVQSLALDFTVEQQSVPSEDLMTAFNEIRSQAAQRASLVQAEKEAANTAGETR